MQQCITLSITCTCTACARLPACAVQLLINEFQYKVLMPYTRLKFKRLYIECVTDKEHNNYRKQANSRNNFTTNTHTHIYNS